VCMVLCAGLCPNIFSLSLVSSSHKYLVRRHCRRRQPRQVPFGHETLGTLVTTKKREVRGGSSTQPAGSSGPLTARLAVPLALAAGSLACAAALSLPLALAVSAVQGLEWGMSGHVSAMTLP